MPVTNQTPFKSFTAAPGATLFSTDFRVILASDLVVRKDGVVQSSGFTVSGLGNPTGVDVTFGAPMVGGEFIELLREVPLVRPTDYQQLGDFLSPVVNIDFDRIWQALQGIFSRVTGAIRVPYPEQLDELPAPAERASRLVGFDALGGLTTYQTGSGVTTSENVAHLASGTGAVATTVREKLRESVSVADFGGVPAVDCAAALLLAGAATTGPVLVPAGAWVATVTTANSAGILALLKRIRCDGTLTLNLDAGTHALTEQVVVNSPDAHRIQVLGAPTVSTTATSQVSVSGAAKAYSVVMGVASSAGVAVGDYAMVRVNVTGTGDFYAHAGVWRVTAVDAGGANRLTLLNTHHGAAFPTNTLTGGSVVILKTVLQWTGCDGLRFEGGQPLGLLNRVALVGDYNVAAGTGTQGAHGIITSSPVITGGASSNAVFNMSGSVTVGESVGVSAWGEQGVALSGRDTMVANFIACCSNRKRGMYAEGASIRSKFAVCSGNGEDGFIADTTGFIQAALSIASGNGFNGFWSTNNSLIAAADSIASGNLFNGFEARGAGRMGADACISINNTLSGYFANDGAMMDADGATATGNGVSGFYAQSGALIDCDTSISTGNTGYGYRCEFGSVVRAAGSTVSGNTIGNYYSRNDSVLFESGGTINPNDIGSYEVSPRFYNPTKANYWSPIVTSTGDLVLSTGTSRFVLRTDGTMYPVTDNAQVLGRVTERWSSVFSRQFLPGAGTAIWTSGTGTPEGAITAPVGSLYTNTTGGSGTTLYIKESGAGNTGWVAK